MGYGSSPATQSVISQAIFSQTATVSDKDTYQRAAPPNDYQEIINSAIDIAVVIRSGTVQSLNDVYVAATGIRTKTWVIKAHTVAASQVVTYIDEFQALDTGNVTVVKDADPPFTQNLVMVSGPTGGGGGG